MTAHVLYLAVSAKDGRCAWSWRRVSGGPFADGTGTDPWASPYRLRLHAMLDGLQAVADGEAVEIVTTDPNTIRLFEEWLPAWRTQGFRKKAPESWDLLEALLPHVDRVPLSFRLQTSRTGDFHAKDCSRHAKQAAAAMDPPEVRTAGEVTVRDDVEVVAWTDGGSRKNPGPSGWGVVLVHLPTGTTKLLRGGDIESTNNRMELTAVAEALASLTRRTHVEIRTDSRFAIQVCTEWLQGWKRRGWRKADGEAPVNLDVIQRLDGLLVQHTVRFTWVKGHAGEPGNELADDLCNRAIDAVLAGGSPDSAERLEAPPFTILRGGR